MNISFKKRVKTLIYNKVVMFTVLITIVTGIGIAYEVDKYGRNLSNFTFCLIIANLGIFLIRILLNWHNKYLPFYEENDYQEALKIKEEIKNEGTIDWDEL